MIDPAPRVLPLLREMPRLFFSSSFRAGPFGALVPQSQQLVSLSLLLRMQSWIMRLLWTLD